MTAGLAATLADAVALAGIIGPGAKIGFDPDSADILAPRTSLLTPADASAGVKSGKPRYHFTFGNTATAGIAGKLAPVIEALSTATGTGFMAACLAAPWAGRRVFQGHLFEAGILKEDLKRAFAEELGGGTGVVPHETVAAGPAAIRRACAGLKEQGRMLALIDAIDEADCAAIKIALAGQPLIGGGAWLAASNDALPASEPAGPLAILSGALNRQTLLQIAAARNDLPVFDLDVGEPDSAAAALTWAASQFTPFIITSSVPPDKVTPNAALPGVFGRIAKGLMALRVTRLIVTGNDTGAAVVKALGYPTLTAEASFGGLVWLRAGGLSLCLKPGGAGAKNLFLHEFGPQSCLNESAEWAT